MSGQFVTEGGYAAATSGPCTNRHGPPIIRQSWFLASSWSAGADWLSGARRPARCLDRFRPREARHRRSRAMGLRRTPELELSPGRSATATRCHRQRSRCAGCPIVTEARIPGASIAAASSSTCLDSTASRCRARCGNCSASDAPSLPRHSSPAIWSSSRPLHRAPRTSALRLAATSSSTPPARGASSASKRCRQSTGRIGSSARVASNDTTRSIDLVPSVPSLSQRYAATDGAQDPTTRELCPKNSRCWRSSSMKTVPGTPSLSACTGTARRSSGTG